MVGIAQLVAKLFGFACVALVVAQHAQAQATVQTETIIGTWIVSIEGEAETRTLVVDQAAQTQDGLLLSAKYNLSSRKPSPVAARILITGEKRQLLLTTQANSVITATEQQNGTYSGTFTPRSGNQRVVTIARADATEGASANQRWDPLAQVPLSPNTAPGCAAFHGNWRGTWSLGGFGEVPMRVLEAASKDEKCIVRLLFGSWKAPLTVEFSGSTLSFLCNRTTQGTCNFRAAGNELWANYSNPAGGTNTGTFRRSSPE